MPTHLVNLDALLGREDFESSGTSESALLGTDPLFKVEELKSDRLLFGVLRKPHFQRETTNWSSERIVQFVKSFLDQEVIPSVIVWHSKETGKVFIIDGAHRVSSLIAWVNDDYGDGAISRKTYEHETQAAQRKLHNATKFLIETEIGSFAHLVDVGLGKVAPKDDSMLRRARTIATRHLQIQKVEGDSEIAASSFFKINSNAIPIDETELDLLHARNKPNTLAARAFMRAGRGHKYWGKLTNPNEVETVAKEVYDLIFGQILEIASTSPDIPKAGQPYSSEAFKMTLDIVNSLNDVTPAMWQLPRNKSKGSEKQLPDDITGEQTLQYLKKVRAVCELSSSNSYSASLGLDHAVYCYGATGRFHPAALLASFRFAQELGSSDPRAKFVQVRREFEESLVSGYKSNRINWLPESPGRFS